MYLPKGAGSQPKGHIHFSNKISSTYFAQGLFSKESKQELLLVVTKPLNRANGRPSLNLPFAIITPTANLLK